MRSIVTTGPSPLASACIARSGRRSAGSTAKRRMPLLGVWVCLMHPVLRSEQRRTEMTPFSVSTSGQVRVFSSPPREQTRHERVEAAVFDGASSHDTSWMSSFG
jgi:hypothetical protein